MIAEGGLQAIDLRGHRCLLDVGGGEGRFLQQAAAHAPHLELMLFDLPAVAERARERLTRAGLARRCTLQVSYAIGVARPLSIYVDTHGTGLVPDDQIERAVAQVMDLTPRGIRTHLGLNRPIYARTAAYGHFGRPPEADGGFSWEKTDLTEALKRAV